MVNPKLTRFLRLYNLLLMAVSLIAIVLTGLDMFGVIRLNHEPAMILINILLIVFASDYLIRFILAKGRARLLEQNTFNLKALVPTDSVLSPDHLRTVFHSARDARQSLRRRWHHLTTRFKGRASRFLRGGGLIYYLGLSAILILLSSWVYAYAEHTNYGTGLWWAIVTATTVGYGDVTPHTLLGRGVAVILMFMGIGLIGTLTSSITAYLTVSPKVSASTTVDELGRLKALLDSGALTQAEYDSEKKKILARS